MLDTAGPQLYVAGGSGISHNIVSFPGTESFMAGNKGSRKVHENSAPQRGGDGLDARLQSLNTRLGALKEMGKPQEPGDSKSSSAGFANAMRLSSEFIVAVLVGAAIGYTIDYFAGTSPWGMIVFFLLGFAAGVLNVLRLAGTISRPSMGDDNAAGAKKTNGKPE